jgi:hypothetical protein
MQEVNTLYRKMLQLMVEHPAPFTGIKELVACYPMSGPEGKVDTMFIGRALNGWHWNFDLGKLKEDPEAILDRIINDRHSAAPDEDRLAWIDRMWGNRKEGYNTARSQFLQVLRGVSESREPKRENWREGIVWTNLLKIAPYGSNPSQKMVKVIGDVSLELILAEIATFQPRNIICLSGMVWAKNLLDSGTIECKMKLKREYLEFAGDVSFNNAPPVRFVVMPHPQTRSSKLMVEEINEALNDLGT